MKAIERLTVTDSATLRSAMSAIEASGAEICLVIDDDGRCVGIVTDGDLRRALLRGATLESHVDACMNRNFAAVGPDVGRAEALDLMLARGFAQVPVLDAAGRLVAVHLLREIVAREHRPNAAIIMAGGRGERLRPLTDHVPKPMIRVAGRPILERLVLHLVGHGIRHIHLAVNYLASVIESHFGDGSAFGCRIEYLRESEPLGSAGAITLLPAAPLHPVVVLNGDLLTQVHVGRLIEHHEAGGYAATVGVREYPVGVPFGVIDRTPDMRLAGFREKPTEVFLINAGIYVLSPACWQTLRPGEALTMPDVLLGCLERGERPGLFLIEDDWHDVGRQEDLRRAEGEVPTS